MRYVSTIILTMLLQSLFGQNKTLVYSNWRNAYYNNDSTKQIGLFFEPKVNEITLHSDSTFEFWSRPHNSCFTWHQYTGTWKKEADTIAFFDSYEVMEKDMRVKFKKDDKQAYIIKFFTNKGSELKNREIAIQYEYDYYAKLDDPEKIFHLSENNTVEIPFRDIPNLNKLASIRVEYQLNQNEKRYDYLTENKIANIRKGDLPNVISVEFIENPKKRRWCIEQLKA